MPTHGREIINRYNKLKNERSNFDDRWEAMAPFVAPSRKGINALFAPGVKQTLGVYDSTTMAAAEISSQFVAGHTINPAQLWFGLKMRNEEISQLDPVKEWLEESRDRMLKNLAASMFYAEAPESLIDYVGFGTGSLLMEELPQPVNKTIEGFRGFFVHADKIGRFVIAEGPDGLVDTEMREFKFTVRQTMDRWGQDSLPENMKQALAKGEIDKQFTFIHDIEPRPKTDRKGGSLGMPWLSVWVEKDSKHIVNESGYNLFPAAVPRYQKTPGEVMGRGRGDLAFPDAWTLNTAKRMGFEDWALKIRPPVLSRHDSVIGSLKLVPAGLTSINTHGGRIQDQIVPFQTGSHPEVSQIKEEELRRSIRQIFFVDQILALMEVQKTQMTATEILTKMDLLFRLLGPVYGRLQREWLTAIVDISFDLMLDAGALSPPPEEVFDTDGTIDVEFFNPIAKAQRAGDIDAINLAINDLAPMGQLFPQIWDGLDPDKLRAHVFDVRGVPAKVVRTEEEIGVVREAREEQDQQENQMAQLKEGSEVARNVAPVVKALGEQGQQGQGVA